MICSRCACICKQEFDGGWISFNLYMRAVYMSRMTPWLSPAHRCVWSHWQVKAALRGLTSSLRNSAPDRLSQNEGSTSMYITPFIDRWDEIGGFENTRLWSTTSKQATRQLLLCYRRKPNQSAVCCSLRLNCTTMFQILVRSAVYAQT